MEKNEIKIVSFDEITENLFFGDYINKSFSYEEDGTKARLTRKNPFGLEMATSWEPWQNLQKKLMKIGINANYIGRYFTKKELASDLDELKNLLGA